MKRFSAEIRAADTNKNKKQRHGISMPLFFMAVFCTEYDFSPARDTPFFLQTERLRFAGKHRRINRKTLLQAGSTAF